LFDKFVEPFSPQFVQVGLCFAIPQIVASRWLPRSPKYLSIHMKRNDLAFESIKWFHGDYADLRELRKIYGNGKAGSCSKNHGRVQSRETPIDPFDIEHAIHGRRPHETPSYSVREFGGLVALVVSVHS